MSNLKEETKASTNIQKLLESFEINELLAKLPKKINRFSANIFVTFDGSNLIVLETNFFYSSFPIWNILFITPSLKNYLGFVTFDCFSGELGPYSDFEACHEIGLCSLIL